MVNGRRFPHVGQDRELIFSILDVQSLQYTISCSTLPQYWKHIIVITTTKFTMSTATPYSTVNTLFKSIFCPQNILFDIYLI